MSAISTVTALMLGLPAAVLAVRMQSEDASLRRHLLVAAGILAAGASVFTLAAFHLIGPTLPLLRAGRYLYGGGVAAAALAFAALRLRERRKRAPALGG